jgi:hypothetical protein
MHCIACGKLVSERQAPPYRGHAPACSLVAEWLHRDHPHSIAKGTIPAEKWEALLALGLNEYQAYRAWQIIDAPPVAPAKESRMKIHIKVYDGMPVLGATFDQSSCGYWLRCNKLDEEGIPREHMVHISEADFLKIPLQVFELTVWDARKPTND